MQKSNELIFTQLEIIRILLIFTQILLPILLAISKSCQQLSSVARGFQEMIIFDYLISKLIEEKKKIWVAKKFY